jgi:hypothetical protein
MGGIKKSSVFKLKLKFASYESPDLVICYALHQEDKNSFFEEKNSTCIPGLSFWKIYGILLNSAADRSVLL